MVYSNALNATSIYVQHFKKYGNNSQTLYISLHEIGVTDCRSYKPCNVQIAIKKYQEYY